MKIKYIFVFLFLFFQYFYVNTLEIHNSNTSHALSHLEYEIFPVMCVNSWARQYTKLTDPLEKNSKYDESHDFQSCSIACFGTDNRPRLSFLKGAQCKCAELTNFNSQLEDLSSCNIQCPIADRKPPSDASHGFKCGGNLRYSVFCINIKGTEDCNEFLSSLAATFSKPKDNNPSLNSFHNVTNRQSLSLAVLEDACAKCTDLSSCKENWLSVSFDYFPLNNAQDCVNFCDSYVEYPYGERKRYSFSILVWWEERESEVVLPICQCANYEIRKKFVETASTDCTTSCPGNPDQICGRSDLVPDAIYATIYCNDDDPPQGIRCFGDPGITAPSTTPQVTETTDPYVTQTSEIFPTTSETSSSTSTLITTSSSSTTYYWVSSTTNANSSPYPEPRETLFCKGKDQYEHYWKVENGTVGQVPCSKLQKNSFGYAFWSCSKQGKFETSKPDVSACKSKWLEEMHKEVEKIIDMDQALGYMDDLSTACGIIDKNFNRQIDNKTYFGHEIKNMTILANEALNRVKNAYIPTNSSGWSKEFPILVEMGVNLDACLIYNRKPWKDLEAPGKSSVSTILIFYIEEKLFLLTSIFKHLKGNEMSWNFMLSPEIPDVQDGSSLFATAEITDGYDNPGYEFPPANFRNGSYIKLPSGWKSFTSIPNYPLLEIAALSIPSTHVEFVMPGQHTFLNDENEKGLLRDGLLTGSSLKVVNGKMISLTISVTANMSKTVFLLSSITNEVVAKSFSDNPVEIIFQHVYSAWETHSYDIPRKLHDGEKPAAAKGSVQCVFWDTKSNLWSTSGCRVMRSTRQETICQCTHLTSFAVLMDLHRYTGKNFGLEILTLILCSVSEISLIFTLIILLSVTNGPQRMRAMISKNLCVCLLIGNGLVLLVLDRNYFDMSEGVCIGAGMVTHYIFLCAFMWMLIEGIHLYRIVEHAFSLGRSYIKQFCIFAYVFPTIIVAITTTIGYLLGDSPYGTDFYCWLEGKYVWAFIGPVLVVTLVNLSVLFIALKTGYRLQIQNQSRRKLSPTSVVFIGKLRSCRTWMKGCLTLTVTLGLTWLVGFYALEIGSTSVVASYIFTILNASQGFFLLVITCTSYRENYKYFTARLKPPWISSLSSTAAGGVEPQQAKCTGKKKEDDYFY